MRLWLRLETYRSNRSITIPPTCRRSAPYLPEKTSVHLRIDRAVTPVALRRTCAQLLGPLLSFRKLRKYNECTRSRRSAKPALLCVASKLSARAAIAPGVSKIDVLITRVIAMSFRAGGPSLFNDPFAAQALHHRGRLRPDPPAE